jgi:hypothetical protein
MTTDAGEAVGRPARTFGGLDIGQSLPVPIGHSATKQFRLGMSPARDNWPAASAR